MTEPALRASSTVLPLESSHEQRRPRVGGGKAVDRLFGCRVVSRRPNEPRRHRGVIGSHARHPVVERQPGAIVVGQLGYCERGKSLGTRRGGPPVVGVVGLGSPEASGPGLWRRGSAYRRTRGCSYPTWRPCRPCPSTRAGSGSPAPRPARSVIADRVVPALKAVGVEREGCGGWGRRVSTAAGTTERREQAMPRARADLRVVLTRKQCRSPPSCSRACPGTPWRRSRPRSGAPSAFHSTSSVPLRRRSALERMKQSQTSCRRCRSRRLHSVNGRSTPRSSGTATCSPSSRRSSRPWRSSGRERSTRP